MAAAFSAYFVTVALLRIGYTILEREKHTVWVTETVDSRDGGGRGAGNKPPRSAAHELTEFFAMGGYAFYVWGGPTSWQP